MDDQTHTSQKKETNRKTLLIVVAILVGAFFLYGSLIAPSTQKKAQNGSVAREQANYTVTMSSGGNDVVGYDIILTYDPKTTSVGTVKSLDPQFQAVQKQAKDGVMAITAIKLPSAQGKSVFDKKPVLSVPVTQQKGAENTVHIAQEVDNNTTKLVNADSQKVYLSDDMVSITPTNK